MNSGTAWMMARGGTSQVATIGLEVRHPELTFATPDYDVSTLGNELTAISEPFRREIVGARIMHGSTASCSLVSRQAPGHSLTEALRQMGAYPIGSKAPIATR